MPWAPACSAVVGSPQTRTPGRGPYGHDDYIGVHPALRAATQDVHERLHRHPGFAAIQAGRIDLADYRALLVRLIGFYVPFERAAGVPPDRTHRLGADLRTVGVDHAMCAALPHCPCIPSLTTPTRRIGALYVVEGAALGGRQLAKALDGLFGPHVTAGREFFLGRGDATGAAWRAFVMNLETFAGDPLACGEIIDAAMDTFAAFELWLNGWHDPELAH